MGFDIAVNNMFCADGKKVENSVKAAYLYSDKVRVYDLAFRDEDLEMLKRLEYSDKKGVTVRELEEEVKKYTERPHLDYLGYMHLLLSKNILVFNSFHEHTFSEADFFIRMLVATGRIEEERHHSNKSYSKFKYERELDKLGIDHITPIMPFEKDEFMVNQPYYDFLFENFFNDNGFKLMNNPNFILKKKDRDSMMSAPVYLSDSTLSALPGFEDATIDEIIDIRKELDKYIIPYRSAVLRISKSLQDIPDTKSLQRECATLYLQEIEPRVKEINAAINDNNVFKNIAKGIITEKETWIGIGALIAAFTTTGDIAGAVSMGTAVAMGGLSMSKGITKTIEENKKLKDNEMYFLYKTGKRLGAKKANKDLKRNVELHDEFQVYD